jgi:DNA-binding LytR/AlgR family response regulator
MTGIRCLIADDEPIARDIILKYCSHLSHLQVVAVCENALQAKQVLQKEKVELIFLDINMPVLDGISFIKTLRQPPQVIFTTAYKEYALTAFDLDAVDYLLKPFSLDRFIVAVDKAIEKLNRPTAVTVSVSPDESVNDALFIRTDNKIFRVLYRELIYAEASGNYTKVVTTSQVLLPSITFTSFEQQLPPTLFVRVHRSFIINKSMITFIEGNRVFLDKIEVPIGSNYKDAFLKELKL